jgi:hypothetical protein
VRRVHVFGARVTGGEVEVPILALLELRRSRVMTYGILADERTHTEAL